MAGGELGLIRLQACADLPLPSLILDREIRVPSTGRVDIFMPRGARIALQPRPLLPGTQTVQVRFAYIRKQASGRQPHHPLEQRQEGRFDARLVQGQVRLQELKPGRWRFWIAAAGWPESGPVEIVLEEDGLRPVRLVPLVGPCELRGQLRDEDKQPLAGLLLRLYAVKGASSPSAPLRAPHVGWLVQIRTDSHGDFRFLGLPLGNYQLWSRNAKGQETRLAGGRLHSGSNPPLQLLLRN
jgi:hypothetical protein